MKLEDPTETWDFFTKTAGEAYVTKVDSFQTKESSIANSYMDTKSSSFEKRARVDLLDLKEQTEGEAHIFFKSKIVRARMFYANPRPVKQLKINQFLKVEPPPDDLLMKLQKQLSSFYKIIESGDLSINKVLETEEISLITTAWREATAKDPIERGVAALIAYQGHSEPEPVEDLVEEAAVGFINIFTPLQVDAYPLDILAVDKENFVDALLPINETRNQMMAIERLAGAKDRYAGTVANELIKDFQASTSYPPVERDDINAEELTDVVEGLCANIQTTRKKAQEKEQESS
jgi:intracellular multiplication protein IcmO